MKNIAVLGSGYWGKNLVRNFSKLGVLSTVCDISPKRIAAMRKEHPGISFTTSVEDILKDDNIKAIVIATPAETHFALAKKALNSGKDVFVEKPLALNAKEGQELIRIARKKKRILMIDHVLQYHPAVAALKELIKKGKIGDIQYIYSNRLNMGKLRKEENILWSFAPHDISLILSLTGELPKRVDAFGEAYLQKSIYDTTVTTLTFKKIKAHIFVSWLHPFKEQKFVVVGSKNMAVFNDQAEDKLLLYPHKVKWIKGIPTALKAEHKPVKIENYEPLARACSHFLECIRKRKSPLTDGNEALDVLKVLNKAQRALERGSDEKK